MIWPFLPLNEEIREMKSAASFLCKFTDPISDINQEDIYILKSREIMVDGQEIIAFLSRSDYDKFYMDTLVLTSRNSVILPFSVVCKIGVRFFGSKHLVLFESFLNFKKNYTWNLLLDKNNKARKNNYIDNGKLVSYNNISFIHVKH